MKSQELQQALMDYLYGEMTDTEKKVFEKKLLEESELKKELVALQEVREQLGKLEDKEVMEPFSITSQGGDGWFKGPKMRKVIQLNPIVAIAVSLVIIMLVGYVTRFSVSYNERGFQLGFNLNHEAVSERALTEADVKRILARELRENTNSFQASLTKEKEALQTRLTSLENSIDEVQAKEKQAVTSDDLNQFFIEVQDRNARLLQQYLNQSSTQQQQYFKTMLTQFNDFLQEQRKEDLNEMKSEIIELKYSQIQQKSETDQVLAGLISTVNQNQN